MADDAYYIVRGAKMKCNCGSHSRQIHLPVSHGSYVNSQPMMNEGDYKPENVPYFGICSSSANPGGESVTLLSEQQQPITGTLCCPMLMDHWLNTKLSTKVEGLPALITSSKLICGHQGVITFVTNGQQPK